MDLINYTFSVLLSTIKDVLPIIVVIVFFQAAVLRKKVDNLFKLIYGCVLVVIGLAVFFGWTLKRSFSSWYIHVGTANKLSLSRQRGRGPFEAY